MVQFLDESPSAAPDEELPEPGSSRRAQLGVLVVVVAVVLGLLVARAASGHRHAPAAATSGPAPSALPYTAPPGTDTPFLPRLDTGPSPADYAACPEAGDGQPACSSSDDVPKPVGYAVVGDIPGSLVVQMVEERLRDTGQGEHGLWYRRVRAVRGRYTITVVVRRSVASDFARSSAGDDSGHSFAYAERIVGHVTVIVEITAPAGHHPQQADARALARDPRLLTDTSR